jgi:CheY-like chemotaxis protein
VAPVKHADVTLVSPPQTVSEPISDRKSPTSGPQTVPEPPSLREPTAVLFVDDEEAVLRSIARVLARSSLSVFTAASAPAALELLGQRRIDVLVSDIDMPQVDGLDLLRTVRRDHPTVLRMFLTGAATLDRALHAINEGEVARFFCKPFDVALFREAMEALAERVQRSRREQRMASRRERQEALQRWLDRRYPDLLSIERSASGEIVVDAVELCEAIDRAGLPRDLLP